MSVVSPAAPNGMSFIQVTSTERIILDTEIIASPGRLSGMPHVQCGATTCTAARTDSL